MGFSVQYRVGDQYLCFRHAVIAAGNGDIVQSEVISTHCRCDLEIEVDTVLVYKDPLDKTVLTEQVIDAETGAVLSETPVTQVEAQDPIEEVGTVDIEPVAEPVVKP